MSIKNWLKDDKLTLGLLLGLIIPVPVALLFAILLRLLQIHFYILGETRLINMFLLGIAVNILVMRQYIIKQRFEKTAKGLIIVTVILVLVFFLFLRNSNFTLPF